MEEELEEELEEEITYHGDSINACDVDETIEAPFWANNTGGKMLALLNLYPFEQYIHIETCQSEMQEGLCRPGCRCEQQYRLHRLLAFDPNNECRGIFSDWFRFPSFCLCKCYGGKDLLQGSRAPKNKSLDKAGKSPAQPGPGPTHNRPEGNPPKEPKEGVRESKDSKLLHHRLSDIPAVFPYEGRAALFAELQQYKDQEFKIDVPEVTPIDPVETVETLWSLGDSTGHMDNVVESGDQVRDMKKARKEGRGLDTHHFFYNQPIMDFVLPDGSVGTLQQTP